MDHSSIDVLQVGYKFRFFGDDAEVAAKECNIFCYRDRYLHLTAMFTCSLDKQQGARLRACPLSTGTS